jgi:hypothetical protein
MFLYERAVYPERMIGYGKALSIHLCVFLPHPHRFKVFPQAIGMGIV